MNLLHPVKFHESNMTPLHKKFALAEQDKDGTVKFKQWETAEKWCELAARGEINTDNISREPTPEDVIAAVRKEYKVNIYPAQYSDIFG